ncbi:sortase [Fusicatenibacter sp.]
MILGAVLIGAALSLFLYNEWDSARAEERAEQVLEQMQKQTEDDAAEEETENENLGGEETERTEQENTLADTDDFGEKMISIDGNEYIGWISIPSISLELPVMAQWSEEGLKTAPGRYAGSLAEDNLVIAGHNYRRHFSPIKWLEPGTEVSFTDAEERVRYYEIEETEELLPDQVDAMITKTETDTWDLTLFTCTTSGQARCAVRCKRIDKKIR